MSYFGPSILYREYPCDFCSTPTKKEIEIYTQQHIYLFVTCCNTCYEICYTILKNTPIPPKNIKELIHILTIKGTTETPDPCSFDPPTTLKLPITQHSSNYTKPNM